MSHIATPQFYDSISADLKILSASGYIIYTEWVWMGTQVNQERFDRLLGVKMTHSLYSTLAGSIGLVAQGSGLYTGIPAWSLQNGDISIDTIISLIGTGNQVPESTPIDLENELRNITERTDNFLFGPLIRAFLNFLLRSGGDIDLPMETLPGKLYHTILYERNLHLVNAIEASDQKNIVLVYGALHFEGIYSLLRSHDPKWSISSIKPLYPYSY